MLKETQKTPPYIWVFKLVTGEEIITTVLEDNPMFLTIKNPLCMVATQKGFQFAPALMMSEPGKGIVIARSAIVASAPPATELEGQYESVTTGIALPQKSSIIT